MKKNILLIKKIYIIFLKIKYIILNKLLIKILILN